MILLQCGVIKASESAPDAALSRSGERLLQTLQRLHAPVTVAVLVEQTRLHPHTVRENLDALLASGLASRQRATPTGRGRPPWLYEATQGEATSSGSEYAGLAVALAGVIQRGSATPRQDGVDAGVHWGRQLARHASASAGHPARAAHPRLLSLLQDMGFAPRADPSGAVVRLTRCPLVDAARLHPDVVCGVHLGIVRGALREFGAAPLSTALVPFAEPGACRLELGVQASGAPA